MSDGDPISADAYIGDNGALKDGWMDNLPEDFRDNETLRNTKDIQGLSSQLVNAQKQLGTAIQMPNKDATPEQRAEFNQKFGCPKTVEGYEIPVPTELPEGMEYRQDLVDAVSAVAFKNGAPKQLMQELNTAFNQWQIENFKTQKAAQEAAVSKTFDDSEAALKVEWGADFDKNIEITNKLTAQIPELMDIVKLVFETTGKGNHPVVHKALFKAALKILPDTVVTGDASGEKGDSVDKIFPTMKGET